VIRQAEEQGMGVILMRPLTSGVFQRLMAEAFPDIDVLEVHLAGGNDRPKLGVFSRGARRIRTSDPAVMSSNPISAAESAKSTTASCTSDTPNYGTGHPEQLSDDSFQFLKLCKTIPCI
jgi:hypothetical protein